MGKINPEYLSTLSQVSSQGMSTFATPQIKTYVFWLQVEIIEINGQHNAMTFR
tara:strand:+ start:412 stop:570 length:159 start_codon:yes stop_codon:yes gene_type:complete